MSAQDLSPREGVAQRPVVQSESSSSAQHAEVLQRLGNIEQALALLRFPMPAPLLKVSEAAKILKVSESSIRRWIEDGKLKASRFDLGQRAVYRIKQIDLDAFIETGSCATSTSGGEPVAPVRSLQVPVGLV